MALTTDQLARRAQLQAAYDNLISGKLVSKVASAGRSVEYGQADKDKLLAAIEELDALARAGARRRGAIGFRL